MLGAIAVLAGPWLMRRRQPADAVNGTLLVTGVSPRPDAAGEQFVTVTGVITWVYDCVQAKLIPVVYSPKNPDNWRVAPAGPPGWTPDNAHGGI